MNGNLKACFKKLGVVGELLGMLQDIVGNTRKLMDLLKEISSGNIVVYEKLGVIWVLLEITYRNITGTAAIHRKICMRFE